MVSRRGSDTESDSPGQFSAELLRKALARSLGDWEVETWFSHAQFSFLPPNRVQVVVADRMTRARLNTFVGAISDASRELLRIEPQIEVLLDGQALDGLVDRAAPAKAPWIQEAQDAPGAARSEPATSFELSTVNPEFTFADFVVGPNNEFAYHAAFQTAESPGATGKVLFICGGVGLGKTHLLNAIVLHATRDSGRVARFLTSETFVNLLDKAQEERAVTEFRAYLRSADLLVIDDVQLITGHREIQDELYHTVNEMAARGKVVVLSSDSSPQAIPGLEERLCSRFKMGVTAKIKAPSIKVRTSIIARKTRMLGGQIDTSVAEHLAKHLPGNIRDLGGALLQALQILALKSAHESKRVVDRRSGSKTITLAVAEQLLAELNFEPVKPGTPNAVPAPLGTPLVDDLLERTAASFNLRTEDLRSMSRSKSVSMARMIAVYLCKLCTPLSLAEIGKCFGRRDHSTICHLVHSARDKVAADEEFAGLVRAVATQVPHFPPQLLSSLRSGK